MVSSAMDPAKVRKNERQLQALTSLKAEEFDELLPVFQHRYEQKRKHFDMRGKRRNKPLSARAMRNPTKTLPTVVDTAVLSLAS